MKKAFPFIFIVVALSLTLVVTAAASIIIDSSSVSTSVTAPISTYKRGIVFTTGGVGPYTINDLKLRLNAIATGDYTINAGIYDVSSNRPNSPKTSETLPIHATITGYQLYDFNSTVLNSLGTYSLISNTQYALIFTGISSNNLTLARNGLSLNSYTVSDDFSVNNSVFSSGGSWSSVPTQNYALQLDVTGSPTAVPEPSTYALLCISLGVVGYARKRINKLS